MKKELNKKSDVVTVVIDVSFKDNIETVGRRLNDELKRYILSFWIKVRSFDCADKI